MSKIEWTQKTWNPSIGCTKISQGCKNCYAEVMAKRLQAMGNKDYKDSFRFKILPQRLNYPLTIKKSTLFFVNSMSDLFHEQMPFSFLDKVFNIIRKTPQHFYQVLTKRASIMKEYCQKIDIPKNVILGVSVENKKALGRIDILRQVKVSKFLSIEPLLEDLGGDLVLSGIDWVIVGGESGYGARPMRKEWVINIQKACLKFDVPFFFKQWGAYGEDGLKRNKKANGRLLDKKQYSQVPELLTV